MPKFRQMYNKFIAEGDKVCTEFAKCRKYQIEHIFTTDPHHSINHIVNDVPLTVVKQDEMAQISALKTASTMLLVLKMPENDQDMTLIMPTKAIYLDGVQDPGNVGTIIRIADWFGIDTVIRSSECADYFNPKTVQATMGSMVNVALLSMHIDDVVKWKLPLIGTQMDATSVVEVKLPPRGIMVMGSEGRGMSPPMMSMLTQSISVPGANHKIADSLNVGIATGIICSYWTSKI
jgi:RNA methyltransferase, TrmH family